MLIFSLQKLSPRFTIVKAETSEQVDGLIEGRSLDAGSRRGGRGRGCTRGRGRGSIRGRGRRGRGRGGRGSREGALAEEIGEENIGKSGKTWKYSRRGRTRGRGRRYGRRSVRPRQRSDSHEAAPRATFFTGFGDVGVFNKEDSAEESLRSSGGDEWGIEARTYKEESSSGSHTDGDGQAGDEYDEQVPDYTRHYSEAKPMGDMQDDSEDEADGDTEEEEDEDDGEVAYDDMEPVDGHDEEINDDDAMDDDEMVDDDEEMVDDYDEEISDGGVEGYGDEEEEGSFLSSGSSD